MDDLHVGLVFRAIRIRRGLRQIDVAAMAGVSGSTISRIERGHLGLLSIEVIRKVAAVLEIRLELLPRWRGGDLDRLINARHSALHEDFARILDEAGGWTREPEVSFAIYGERGVVDVLAYHPQCRMLLVVELKTDIADVNELVGTLDRKRRLAHEIATQHGWSVRGAQVAVWLAVADGSTNRHRVAAHQTMLRAAYPTDGRTVRRWLQSPTDPIRALSYVASPGRRTGGLRVERRVQAARRSDMPAKRRAGGAARR